MPDDDPSGPQPKGWLDVVSSLVDGGLPQVIAGPAGKAVSRLIAGGADIPAAWLEKRAQAIRDEKDTRSTIMKAIAKAGADRAVTNPDLLDRGLDRYIGELYRKQENREGVAAKTVEYLRLEPPPLEVNEDVSDDWLNAFECYAENASSEKMRDLWGRVLAGEIRKPGAFSLRTLHFVSLIDAAGAALIEKALPFFVMNRIAPYDLVERKLAHRGLLSLEEMGFVVQIGPELEYKVHPNRDGYFHIQSKKFVFSISPRNETVKFFVFKCLTLSNTGQEISKILAIEEDADAVAKALWRCDPRPKSIAYAKILRGREYGEWINQPQAGVVARGAVAAT